MQYRLGTDGQTDRQWEYRENWERKNVREGMSPTDRHTDRQTDIEKDRKRDRKRYRQRSAKKCPWSLSISRNAHVDLSIITPIYPNIFLFLSFVTN